MELSNLFRRRLAILTSLLAPAALVLTAISIPASQATAQDGNAGTGTCKWTTITGTFSWDDTRYRTNVLKAVVTIGGLFGRTYSCYTVTQTGIFSYSKYEYTGPPLPHIITDSSGPPIVEYEVRLLAGKADCYGDLVTPDLGAEMELARFIGLDGSVFDLIFEPITGSLEYFLGDSFDPSPFDPAYLAYPGWKGHRVMIPESALQTPTLALAVGGDPQVPLQGLMNLIDPDEKVLRVVLGPNAANADLSVVVSNTPPGDGPLMVVDGVTVPIVPDDYTAKFDEMFPGLGGTANTNGVASIAFPQLWDLSWEAVDLYVAVIARDPTTGTAIAASTPVNIQLRDFGICQ